jgi:hypothetical protein
LAIRGFGELWGLDKKCREQGSGNRDQDAAAMLWPGREEGPGEKVRSVRVGRRVPGSFAALRMTARTDNSKDKQRQGQAMARARG